MLYRLSRQNRFEVLLCQNIYRVKSLEIYKKMQNNFDREIGYIIEIRHNLIFN